MDCGKHQCPLMCHLITDASHKHCVLKVDVECSRNHPQKLPCCVRAKVNQLCSKKVPLMCERSHTNTVACHYVDKYKCVTCEEEDVEAERVLKRNMELEKEANAKREAHEKELRRIREEIAIRKRLEELTKEEFTQRDELQAALGQLEKAQRDADAAAAAAAAAAKKHSENAKNLNKKTTTPPAPLDLNTTSPSLAEADWIHQKTKEGAKSPDIDDIMRLIGLESVKERFLDIKGRVDTAILQGVSLSKERFSCVMLGNPGTGKTTVARILASFLCEMGVVPGKHFEETTGAKLASGGPKGCTALIDKVLDMQGGVIFIDEAYQLTSGNNAGGAAVLDVLLAEIENYAGKIVFIVAGYACEMELFFSHNPGLTSRFPVTLKFEDYTDDELLKILQLKMHGKWAGRIQCASGNAGLYPRIVARRVGYGRGHPGFGNARAMENALSRIQDRQSRRLRKERQSSRVKKASQDIFELTKEDIIGPEPGDALAKSKAWKKLQEMVGLASVKESIKVLVDSTTENYHRELEEKPSVEFSLNKVFLGNPGTGKTTIAKLYGEILRDIGTLTNGEVVVKTPPDFIGDVIGGSELKTKGILASTVGKVLVIDEAYGFNPNQGNGSHRCPFRNGVIDTIVGEVHNVPGDNRAVLLLGYKDRMEEMFKDSNPGFARRFPMSSAFTFEDFSTNELTTILQAKLKSSGLSATGPAQAVALEVIERARSCPNFGNAGEVDILLNRAKASHLKRVSRREKPRGCAIFDETDFDPDYDRSTRPENDIAGLFKDSIGMEKIVDKLRGFQEMVRVLKSLDMDPKQSIPFAFIFRGPPGTGKTSTARKMAQVYYDLGFLAAAELIEVSASQIIGKYLGHTGPLVRDTFDKALGRVLFIDEAYRLGSGDRFAQEALDEIVDCITKERYNKRLIIILAGYEKDMNSLMKANEGLTSRFPEVVDFCSFGPSACLQLLTLLLQKKSDEMGEKGVTFDISEISKATSQARREYQNALQLLSSLPGWANARDVDTICTAIFNHVLLDKQFGKGQPRILSKAQVLKSIRKFETERHERAANTKKKNYSVVRPMNIQSAQDNSPPPLPPSNTSSGGSSSKSNSAAKDTSSGDEKDDSPGSPRYHSSSDLETLTKTSRFRAPRDPNVSDADWEKLQRDIEAEEKKDAEIKAIRKKIVTTKASSPNYGDIVKKLMEAEEQEKKREAERTRVAELGLCPAGYIWINQGSGLYKCAGGSHVLDIGTQDQK